MWYKLTWMYVGQQKIRPSGWWGWQPWANTIAYYPLDSTNTVNDLSGNNYTLTNWNSTPFQTYYGVDCAVFDHTLYNYFEAQWLDTSIIWNTLTVSIWCNTPFLENGNNETAYKIIGTQRDSPYRWWCLDYYTNWSNTEFSRMEVLGSNWSALYNQLPSANVRHNLIWTYNGSNITFYIDGVQVATGTARLSTSDPWTLQIGRALWGIWIDDSYFDWWISAIIIEDQVRDATMISDYYDLTKWNYWIS